MDSGEKGVANRSEDRSGWIVMLGDEDADKCDGLMRGSLSPATGKEVDSMVVVTNIDGLMAAVILSRFVVTTEKAKGKGHFTIVHIISVDIVHRTPNPIDMLFPPLILGIPK